MVVFLRQRQLSERDFLDFIFVCGPPQGSQLALSKVSVFA